MCDETNQERQDNEMFALRSIYEEAVEDNRRKSVWKEWHPLNILLTLQPSHTTNGVHCGATLQFDCCDNYPDIPPNITIDKSFGLSDDNVQKLLKELHQLADDLCGEVMIFQLAQHTQQFLNNHNKPILSFYDEMVREKDEMEKLKQHDIQVKENEELQKMKDEIERCQKAMRGSVDSSCSSDLNSDQRDGQGDTSKLLYYADDKTPSAKRISKKNSGSVTCTCNIKGAKVLRYTQKNNKKVYVGNCIGHSANGATTFPAIDDDGEKVIAKRWYLAVSADFQTRNRKINALQQDLKAMCRLKHTSLVPYVAMEINTESKKTGLQNVYIFRDFVLGTSLKYLREKSHFGDKLERLKLVRHVGLGVFSALKELHSVNVLHRDVSGETVFLEVNGGVKLVGASLDVRLTEMIEEETYCDRQTKAQDIYAAAQLLLSIVTEESGKEVPPDLPITAKDFFSRCLIEDEQYQWTAEQLVEHVFLLDVAPSKLLNGKEKTDSADSGSEDEDGDIRIRDISTLGNGQSRLNVEFEVLNWIGKGAFGDVVKVKNKLDGGFYAIKHIKLNPKSVELNKKITREVKLLSRLYHENVVRYYNAWIETITETEEGGEIQESSVVNTPAKNKGDSLLEVVAKLGQDIQNRTWSMPGGPVQVTDESSETEEDSDDEEPWINIMKQEEESSSAIEFEANSKQSETLPSEDTTIQLPMSKQVLYIQMEFCEKNTLRQAIDNGLYQENVRAWRLFREILEGLAHVHQKGMIHRDLKPVNIFLDSNDHVKIGDFGLATKVFSAVPVEDIQSQEDGDGLLTGKVGTKLYVAPELQQSAIKGIYNQKVDIYSLGIILFEMFHSPFYTGTERISVLTNLRKKEIVIPKEFQREENSKQIHVIRWLLDHDPSLRPTSAELRSSKHVPRAVPEGTFAGVLSHALSERGSRNYQRLVYACLDQKPSPAEDFLYHSGLKAKSMDVLAALKDMVVKVFQNHGGIEFTPPLMIPRTKRWDQYSNAVRIMTSSGSICHLPHDLRLPFARHIAYSGTKYMRRYLVDRVYREKTKGFHPRELIECAFDIVTPRTETLWPDAELLVVASRAAIECSLKVTIQLNHTDLLKTLLLSCGVPQDKHDVVYPVLVDVSLGRLTSLQLQTHLTTLCVTKKDITNMIRLMEADVPIKQVRELVGSMGRNKWGSTLERAIRQLEAVCTYAIALGCDVPITVAPFLAYNATQHCGVFWKLSMIRNEQHPTTKHRSRDLIAAGGRYDNLVEEFWKVARVENDHNNAELKCTSVGFCMSLDRMAEIFKNMEVEVSPVIKKSECNTICVFICNANKTVQDGSELKRAQIARDLWASGHSALCWFSNPADAHDLTKSSMVLVHDSLFVLASCWEGTRVREFKVCATEVMEFVKQKLNPDIIRNPDCGNRTTSWPEGEKSNGPTIAVTFITASERITKSIKRQCEVQINNQMTSILVNLGLQPVLNRVRVNVLALACEANCVRALAANLSVPIEAAYLQRAFQPVCDTYFKRTNILEDALRELTIISKQVNQSRSPDETQLYALFSIPDSICRMIT
ncbi:eIF-2-alpha kinase GCN2 isoform X1 [Pararge aegeria]|uniref:eIF-2-alpha kinase GCN2 isoform X1 n=2 Tax=Pararge aegeria TaxID=116150 RepID=UPI0019D1B631|nr:eIF-2-alpha kinase GCN2 isoform X1 [Pararge aegeria]